MFLKVKRLFETSHIFKTDEALVSLQNDTLKSADHINGTKSRKPSSKIKHAVLFCRLPWTMNNETFTTVALYQYATEAQIVKGRLESDGIAVFLSDHLIMGTDPLLSKAIGGIKLKVRSNDAVAAKQILNSMQQYSVDDEENFIRCPNCKSTHVELFSTIKDLKSLFRMLSGALFSSVPLYPKHKYRCEMCETEFDLK